MLPPLLAFIIFKLFYIVQENKFVWVSPLSNSFVIKFLSSPTIQKNQPNRVLEFIVDSNTRYICGILPYYGTLTTKKLGRPILPVSTRILLQLYKMLFDKIPGAQEHHMFTYRYYTSYTSWLKNYAKWMPFNWNDPDK